MTSLEKEKKTKHEFGRAALHVSSRVSLLSLLHRSYTRRDHSYSAPRVVSMFFYSPLPNVIGSPSAASLTKSKSKPKPSGYVLAPASTLRTPHAMPIILGNCSCWF
ncbi:unnamed protein product [Eruca vesicaria subsp. sativa]|uniref:Uncharacterized protein n=1 Tax=Eruca vesicaria subsp. sativa TaxID=29727 RepID=A0ABC8K8H8_ERUVS|nr:unnamed protein product [Eruca vesicaria subsp. sativa]